MNSALLTLQAMRHSRSAGARSYCHLGGGISTSRFATQRTIYWQFRWFLSAAPGRSACVSRAGSGGNLGIHGSSPELPVSTLFWKQWYLSIGHDGLVRHDRAWRRVVSSYVTGVTRFRLNRVHLTLLPPITCVKQLESLEVFGMVL